MGSLRRTTLGLLGVLASLATIIGFGMEVRKNFTTPDARTPAEEAPKKAPKAASKEAPAQAPAPSKIGPRNVAEEHLLDLSQQVAEVWAPRLTSGEMLSVNTILDGDTSTFWLLRQTDVGYEFELRFDQEFSFERIEYRQPPTQNKDRYVTKMEISVVDTANTGASLVSSPVFSFHDDITPQKAPLMGAKGNTLRIKVLNYGGAPFIAVGDFRILARS
jgi:hypothetical protein